MEKVCFKCGKTKVLADFYKHKETLDGHLGKCKECAKMDATNYRTTNIETVRAYDRARGILPHRIAANIARTQIRRKQNPLQYAAHILLGNAVRSGKVLKSSVCARCGSRKLIHGHHKDYCKPLDVMWLCTVCHKQQHKIEV